MTCYKCQQELDKNIINFHWEESLEVRQDFWICMSCLVEVMKFGCDTMNSLKKKREYLDGETVESV